MSLDSHLRLDRLLTQRPADWLLAHTHLRQPRGLLDHYVVHGKMGEPVDPANGTSDIVKQLCLRQQWWQPCLKTEYKS